MKRGVSTFQVVLLAAFGAIGVGAVLIFALATAGGGNGGIGAVTIWGTFNQSTMQQVLRQAANKDSRLDLVTYVQKDPSTFESDLSNALAAGTGPDLFILPADEALQDADKVYPIPYAELPQSQFQNTFVDAADTYLSPQGIVGVPILVDPLVLYWNRDALASAGVASPPQYWDQLPQMAEELTQKDETGALQKSAIALGTYQNIDPAKDILAMLIMQAGGTLTARDSQGKVDPGLSQGGSASSPAQQALTFYTEFANPAANDYSWNGAQPDARQAFAAGQLALYIGLASEEPLIEAANPNLNFAVAPVPELRAAQESLDGGQAYALAIPKHAANLQGALTVAFLIASESVDQSLAGALGLAPARRDAIASATSTGDTQLFDKMALITRTWLDPDPSETGGIFQAMIEGTESGAISISDAISRANQQLGALLDKLQPLSSQ